MIKLEGNVPTRYRYRDEDLNFIVVNTKENIDYLRHSLNIRKRTDKSFWMIDISSFETIQKAYQDLNDLQIDIDDDFYLMKEDFDKIDIWEIYKISPKFNISANYHGYWTKQNDSGLHLDQETKAWRRHNLNGYHFKVTTLVSKPYTNEINIHSLQGIFGDVFEELKVHIFHTVSKKNTHLADFETCVFRGTT